MMLLAIILDNNSKESFYSISGATSHQLTLRYGMNPHQKPAQVYSTGELPFKGTLVFIASIGWIPWLHQFTGCSQCLAIGKRIKRISWSSCCCFLQTCFTRYFIL